MARKGVRWVQWGVGRLAATLGLLVLAAVVCAGCGGSGTGVTPVSGSTEEATVKGVVTLRGKPVNNGYVLFNPVNIKRANVQPRQAPIGKDGSYSLKTLVGDNYVQVDCSELRLPKNRAIADTERTVIVNPGENTVDLKNPAGMTDWEESAPTRARAPMGCPGLSATRDAIAIDHTGSETEPVAPAETGIGIQCMTGRSRRSAVEGAPGCPQPVT